uniref:Uncharacterized protein n=1 Tax=Octopus bimaculoides TaxID=37653 RepID=A0A0L8HTA2_OCTBM
MIKITSQPCSLDPYCIYCLFIADLQSIHLIRLCVGRNFETGTCFLLSSLLVPKAPISSVPFIPCCLCVPLTLSIYNSSANVDYCFFNSLLYWNYLLLLPQLLNFSIYYSLVILITACVYQLHRHFIVMMTFIVCLRHSFF